MDAIEVKKQSSTPDVIQFFKDNFNKEYIKSSNGIVKIGQVVRNLKIAIIILSCILILEQQRIAYRTCSLLMSRNSQTWLVCLYIWHRMWCFNIMWYKERSLSFTTNQSIHYCSTALSSYVCDFLASTDCKLMNFQLCLFDFLEFSIQ